MAELFLTNRAKEDLAALPRVLQEAILDTLTSLGIRPEELGKELRGRLRGLWSCRVGNYRILYTIERRDPSTRVIVRAIRHRAVAYRPRRDRYATDLSLTERDQSRFAHQLDSSGPGARMCEPAPPPRRASSAIGGIGFHSPLRGTADESAPTIVKRRTRRPRLPDQ